MIFVKNLLLLKMININKPIGSRGGERGTPLCKPYRYVQPQRVTMVFALGLFGRKTGIHFAHFGLESGYGFRGNYGSV